MISATSLSTSLPPAFIQWFEGRGWQPHPHQLQMLAAAEAGQSALLIAPTGGGKTLAGFLPSLIDLIETQHEGLHTLYISPLKALTVDIERNLMTPLNEMGIDISIETRTGDTPTGKRNRQRHKPPNILLTTPESLALLASYHDAPELFGNLKCVVIDELHALADNKRGDLLALGLTRLQRLSPGLRRVGLSATVHNPQRLRAWLSPKADAEDPQVHTIIGRGGIAPEVEILTTREHLPWSGHMALHALPEVYERIKQAGTTLIFVNTRAQAELVFQELWKANEDSLPIALHHGSLSVEQRRKVEAFMGRGDLRAIVATSSLDLGVDWGAVDLVVQMGAPKGVSRLLQRLGRANHRLTAPSRALLVPGNRFEVLECRAAKEGVEQMTLDGEPVRPGGLDVLCQHILGMACSQPFQEDELFEEVRRAAPYADLTRRDFDDALAFVTNGGYALRSYGRYRRLERNKHGLWKVVDPKQILRYRMNMGVIVEEPMVKVRLKGGRNLGEAEEYFFQMMLPGDTFFFAGDILCFENLKETTAVVTRAKGAKDPKVPAYAGGRLPLSSHLAERVRAMLADEDGWRDFSPAVQEWLKVQRWKSALPSRQGLLVETFPRAGKQFLVAYCFEGRNAHQTLGMLLTRRMEREGYGPLGFVATDYVIAIWSLHPVDSVNALFDEDMLGDDLEEWMDESSMLKRTFRSVGIVAGLIDRRIPGKEKTGRQVTFNTDLIYDVLRKHQPDHILLRATRAEAAGGLTDISRLSEMLSRIKGRIELRRLEEVSPLAVPVLLEIGRETVAGAAMDELLDEAANSLIKQAMSPSPAQASLPMT